MFEITIDMDELGNFVEKLKGFEQEFPKFLQDGLNAVGPDMLQEATVLVADRVGLPEEAVRPAIEGTPASALNPTFRVSAYSRRAPFFRWITQADERVCEICGPRHDQVYDKEWIDNNYPAHFNCRCLIEEVDIAQALEDVSGQVLDKAVPAVAEYVIAAFERSWTSKR